MDRRTVTAAIALMCTLSIVEFTRGDPNTKLLRWSCHLESDTQLAETPGRHKLWAIPGRGKFATGGRAWTVCNTELDEADCTACVNYALNLANFAVDMLEIDSECSGEGIQIYLQSCKMRYFLDDFLSPPEVLYAVQ